jgi:hypothetical protein
MSKIESISIWEGGKLTCSLTLVIAEEKAGGAIKVVGGLQAGWMDLGELRLTARAKHQPCEVFEN